MFFHTKCNKILKNQVHLGLKHYLAGQRVIVAIPSPPEPLSFWKQISANYL